MTAFVIAGMCLSAHAAHGAAAKMDTPVKKPDSQKAEPKSGEVKSVDSSVQSEVEKSAAEKRAQLLKDAQAAIDETRNAIAALDKGNKKAALAALERVSGKLDLIVARDPKLALAPVSVSTTTFDLYSTPDTVKAVTKTAKDNLAGGNVQQARTLLQWLASETDIAVANIPLASYPAAIKAVTPLIDAGKTDEAKAALYAALNTLVIENYVIPLPKLRAQAMLAEADKLAAKSNRKDDENKRLHSLIEAARLQLQLGEALGYGNAASYKPLYSQLDDLQKKTEGGKSGKGFFDRIQESLRNFKFA